MATLRTGRAAWLFRLALCFMAASLAWLQVSPAYASTAAFQREQARQAAWQAAHRPKPVLPLCLQKPNAALRARGKARAAALKTPLPDVRPLTSAEMGHALGRGPSRNPYFVGSPMPWQRSLRDVNLSTGNLFKSFTDIQIAPGRGAGLVLQRTYNSNDSRIGPFGVGWMHAYDIRMQEDASVQTESGDTTPTINQVDRTDFFGTKHAYHRDADGLYTSPPYLHDTAASDYDTAGDATADTETGKDGTIKHYILNGTERDCDYIQDRHGNRTTLAYDPNTTLPDGRHPLLAVTDPSGRSLVFTWANISTSDAPAWRITQVQGPLDQGQVVPGVTYRIVYGYYTDPNSANAANELYNLKSVTLDPDGVNRTTTYTYTSASANGSTENGLLATITDPLLHQVSYQYQILSPTVDQWRYTPLFLNNSLWVTQISEPASNGTVHTWTFNYFVGGSGSARWSDNGNVPTKIEVGLEPNYILGALFCWRGDSDDDYDPINSFGYIYDDAGNATEIYSEKGSAETSNANSQNTLQTFNPSGGVLTSAPDGFPNEVTTTTYYNADKDFQKQSSTDPNGNTTTEDYFDNADPSPGNRGQVKWVRDAQYGVTGKQFTYTYNQYGQKLSETNLNGVVTQYAYGDQWGNLTQVVQDPTSAVPDGKTHLNRTTAMVYDVMGRVLQSTDPNGQTSTFTYNTLGQPLAVSTPATASVPAETIRYGYGGNGRTESVTDNRGTTVIAYENGNDRVQSVTDPQTGTESYTYAVGGERLSLTLPGGGTWHYYYDVTAYGLTPAENQGSSFLNLFGVPAMSGDDPNTVAPIVQVITDDQGRRIYCQTDLTGRPMFDATDTTYDTEDAPVSQCEFVSQLHYAPQDSGGPLTDERMAQTRTGWNTAVTDNSLYPSPSPVLAENDYTYDNAGNRVTNQITDQNGNTRTESYAYDTLNRLSAVDYGDGEKQGDPTNPAAHPGYTFDPMGNRLTKTDTAGTTTTTTAYTYDAANRLLSTANNGGSASAVTFDANGNTLTDTSGRVNVWDSQNRLVSCTKAGVTSAYTYGADGLRRTSTVNGVTTYYAYDGQTLVQEMKSSQGVPKHLTTTYLQGSRGTECRIDETQQTEGYYHYDPSNDNEAFRDPTTHQFIVFARGVSHWYIYDGLGSVTGEVDVNGHVTSSPKYDVYGAVRSNSGTATSRQGFVGALGHVSDTETGLIYMKARYYDPSIGRFVSEDPAGHGENWFIYASNNPVNRVDLTGKDDYDLAAALIKISIQYLSGVNPSYHLGFPGGSPPNNLADLLRYVDARIRQLLRGGVTEAGEGAVEIKTDQSQSDVDEGAREIEGGNTAEDGAEKVAQAVELKGIEEVLEGMDGDGI